MSRRKRHGSGRRPLPPTNRFSPYRVTKDEPAPILTIAAHPFYIGLLDPAVTYDLPETLPFALGIHPRYAIPRLIMSAEIRAALDAAYALGSMCSTPLGESSLATKRMNEFQNRLTAVLGGVAGKRLLEIGCGNGELLHQLRSQGAIVTGLEIGPQADVVEERYGIRVVRESLAVGSLDEKFDCIYSYGCLEHIEALHGFFGGSRECLESGGLFFHSVPNSTLSFEKASLEHLQHEHVNYFTPDNATALLEAQGFQSADFALTGAGNELMVWGFYDPAARISWPEERVEGEAARVDEYANRLQTRISTTVGRLREFADDGKTIGFYAGGYDYGYRLNAPRVRYFDGDSYKHGKRWLQSLPVIEPPVALRSTSVDRLIICKPHYFNEIKASLVALGIDPEGLMNIDNMGALAP